MLEATKLESSSRQEEAVQTQTNYEFSDEQNEIQAPVD